MINEPKKYQFEEENKNFCFRPQSPIYKQNIKLKPFVTDKVRIEKYLKLKQKENEIINKNKRKNKNIYVKNGDKQEIRDSIIIIKDGEKQIIKNKDIKTKLDKNNISIDTQNQNTLSEKINNSNINITDLNESEQKINHSYQYYNN